MTIEQNYNIGFIASLALREKQIQQNYRPLIGVHKWFARRPGTLFRGLLLSEFGGQPVEEIYYSSNNFEGISVADPFMGGGTPLLLPDRHPGDVPKRHTPRSAWNSSLPTERKLRIFQDAMDALALVEEVAKRLERRKVTANPASVEHAKPCRVPCRHLQLALPQSPIMGGGLRFTILRRRFSMTAV